MDEKKSPLFAAAIQDHITRQHLNSIRSPTIIPTITRQKHKKYPLSLEQRQIIKWTKERELKERNRTVGIGCDDKRFVLDKDDRILDQKPKQLTLGIQSK